MCHTLVLSLPEAFMMIAVALLLRWCWYFVSDTSEYISPLNAFCRMTYSIRSWCAVPYWCTPYIIFSLTQYIVWHMPTLLLQLWLCTGHETLLLGWATFGLLLNCLTIFAQLQQKTTMLCNWLDEIFIANIEPTELTPDHRSVAMCVISKVYRKQPDSLSLPHCPPEPSLRLEDCYKTYSVPYDKKLCCCSCYVAWWYYY